MYLYEFDVFGFERSFLMALFLVANVSINIIYSRMGNTILRRGGKIYVGKNNDKEIDFIVQKANNEREYYQVAHSVNDEKAFNREISAFRNISDNYPKILLTPHLFL